MSDAIIQGNNRSAVVQVIGDIDTPEEAVAVIGAMADLMEPGDSTDDYVVRANDQAYSYEELAMLIQCEEAGLRNCFQLAEQSGDAARIERARLIDTDGTGIYYEDNVRLVISVDQDATVLVTVSGENQSNIHSFELEAGLNVIELADHGYELHSREGRDPEVYSVMLRVEGQSEDNLVDEITVRPRPRRGGGSRPLRGINL